MKHDMPAAYPVFAGYLLGKPLITFTNANFNISFGFIKTE